MEGWVEADPLAAANFIRQNPKLNTARNMLQFAMEEWGRKDPQAAAAYFNSLTPAERALYASDLGRGWAQIDPTAAATWAGTLGDAKLRGRAYSAIAYTWGTANPEAAGQWLNSLPAGHDRDVALSMYSRVMAGGIGMSPPGGFDPKGATQWAAQIADETVRAEAYGQIATAFTTKDPDAALKWLESLPAGYACDRAALSASLTAGPDGPAAAITWAGLIQDEILRSRAYGSVAYWWAYREPAAASAWASQLPAGAPREAALAALTKAIEAKRSLK